LERRFLRLVRDGGLPPPEVNRKAGRHYVDCRWPDHKVTVELDSYRYHHSRSAWEADHRRDRAARARGDEHRRYTWSDVFETPGATISDLAALLLARRPV
jgi:very-short-patch-repair endonuclease